MRIVLPDHAGTGAARHNHIIEGLKKLQPLQRKIAQTCCGQPGYNAGDQRVARDLALQWLQLFEAFDYV
ncbi:MAG: hypothetical protein EBW19_12690, partial [Betaproteobacteria bacterium]|nr:hypothetical protein [Betaproteobacteria bacterium]